MRTRALVVVALAVPFALAAPPTAASAAAQRIPRPRVGRPTLPAAAPLPPEAAEVSRALAYRRSRWSVDSYSLISTASVPVAGDGSTTYRGGGIGTHGDYRFSRFGEHLSGTADMTTAIAGGPAVIGSVEVGARYSPMDWSHSVRPFVDVRADYMMMYDSFEAPVTAAGAEFGVAEDGRYTRGFGGVAGFGMEYTLTRSIALTTEVVSLRNRMSTYRLTGGGVPGATRYWMTTYRYTLGLKFNPVRALHLDQNPRQ